MRIFAKEWVSNLLQRLGMEEGVPIESRLITGDGSPAIENSAFLVTGNQFTRVGRKGEVPLPAGAMRVDLTGKTVMPTIVDMHGHFGFQNLIAGTMSKETLSLIFSVYGLCVTSSTVGYFAPGWVGAGWPIRTRASGTSAKTMGYCIIRNM